MHLVTVYVYSRIHVSTSYLYKLNIGTRLASKLLFVLACRPCLLHSGFSHTVRPKQPEEAEVKHILFGGGILALKEGTESEWE